MDRLGLLWKIMGATASTQPDLRGPEHAQNQDVEEIQEEESTEKVFHENGQISNSSLSKISGDHMDVNCYSDDVGQKDRQMDALPKTSDNIQNVETPPETKKTEEIMSAVADIEAVQKETNADQPPVTNELGFKKIFRFGGLRFTLRKDKNENTDPAQMPNIEEDTVIDDTEQTGFEELVTTQEEEAQELGVISTITKEEPETTSTLAKSVSLMESVTLEGASSQLGKCSIEDITSEKTRAVPEEEANEERTKEETSIAPPCQETQSQFRRFFTQGIFSNLRKKSSSRKTNEAEAAKVKTVGEYVTKTEDRKGEMADKKEEREELSTKISASERDVTEDEPDIDAQVIENFECTKKKQATDIILKKFNEQNEVPVVTMMLEESSKLSETQESLASDNTEVNSNTEVVAKVLNEQAACDKAPAELGTELDVTILQDKGKGPDSPLNKLFTNTSLKNVSSKRSKAKKDETKITRSVEQLNKQLQASTESTDTQNQENEPSSPEDSGEHIISDVAAKQSQNAEDAGSSDGEKRDNILPWTSFKKLVTPKKRPKRPSESDDELLTFDKSATISSKYSEMHDMKPGEFKPTEPSDEHTSKSVDKDSSEVVDQSKDDSKDESKAEKSDSVVEDQKKKLDTSVSWEALICVGSAKRRSRKTSDSEEEDTKLEEEIHQSVVEQARGAETLLQTSNEADRENLVSSSEPEEEIVSTWESFKRLVTNRRKKYEEKAEDVCEGEQALCDADIPKEESSFSLKKLIRGRKKRSDEKHGSVSSDVGSEEEDSETPAVVPLSEYDNELTEGIAQGYKDIKYDEFEMQEEALLMPLKAPSEDRSPSWISAAVDDVEDNTKQLSDIPEEVDVVCTPKSSDNTLIEDILELTAEAFIALEEPADLCAAEGKAVVPTLSRILKSSLAASDTSPIQLDTDAKGESAFQVAMEAVVPDTVSLCEVYQEDVLLNTGAVVTEVLAVSEPQEKEEANNFCTGVCMEYQKCSEVKMPIIESVSSIFEAMKTSVVVEEKRDQNNEGVLIRDRLHIAEVQEVLTEMEIMQSNDGIDVEEHSEDVSDTIPTCNVQQSPLVESLAKIETELMQEHQAKEIIIQVEKESLLKQMVEEAVPFKALQLTEISVLENAVGEPLIKQFVTNESVENDAHSIPTLKLDGATNEIIEAHESKTLEISLDDVNIPNATVSAENTEKAIATQSPWQEGTKPLTEGIDDISDQSKVNGPAAEVMQSHVSKTPIDSMIKSFWDDISTPKVTEIDEITEKGIASEYSGNETIQPQDKGGDTDVPVLFTMEVIEKQSPAIADTVIKSTSDNISEMKKEPGDDKVVGALKTQQNQDINKKSDTVHTIVRDTETEGTIEITEDKPPKTIVQTVQVMEILAVSVVRSIESLQEVAEMTVDGIDLAGDVFNNMKSEDALQHADEESQGREKCMVEQRQVGIKPEEVTQEPPVAEDCCPSQSKEVVSTQKHSTELFKQTETTVVTTVTESQYDAKQGTVPQQCSSRDGFDSEPDKTNNQKPAVGCQNTKIYSDTFSPTSDITPQNLVHTSKSNSQSKCPPQDAEFMSNVMPQGLLNAQEVLELVIGESVTEIEAISTEITKAS